MSRCNRNINILSAYEVVMLHYVHQLVATFVAGNEDAKLVTLHTGEGNCIVVVILCGFITINHTFNITLGPFTHC